MWPVDPSPAALAGGVLTVDLDALVANWRDLDARARADGGWCGAVVKADAYGVGVAHAAPALWRAGCRVFFVAGPDEALALRPLLPQAAIQCLGGPWPGTADALADAGIVPVLNTPEQIAEWRALAARREAPQAAVLHVDTGMNRLGLSAAELEALLADPQGLEGVRLHGVMSHFACADAPDHPLTARQIAAFRTVRERFPGVTPSLANSPGLFRGPEARAGLGRPGIALYGGNPTPYTANPMRPVAHVQGRILQVRQVDTPGTVGYGATCRVPAGARLATVAVGYADGYLRAQSNAGSGVLAGRRVPVVGRISMDLTVFDVTGVPADAARPGAWMTLMGEEPSVDAVAENAGTIPYEILTALGPRYHRVHTGGGG